MQRETNRYNATSHFVWRQEFLGEGAFGTVFKGFHKETGESVAIKTFNRSGSDRRVSQYREFDIIRRLNHPNIVRLIAIEDVLPLCRPSTNGAHFTPTDTMEGKVLIMELCTEGNLYMNLERPENQYGLEESEFLLVLTHMTNGLRYLHENRIIHRDWKPSNILKTITVDGQTAYKLCDFGAARVCDENGKFMSIVGTEDYLHPEIFDRALLKGSNGVFAATSDLWSIGTTLYHTATALLPFRPYGGCRRNREMMHRMMTEKASGVISGYQDTENGPIRWRRDLPAHCLLSSGLRPLVTKLLAGLLESKQHQMWNYERYFQEVSKILSKVVVKFYVLGEWNYRTVYLDRTADYSTFRSEVLAQLDSRISEFCLSMGGQLLDADNWDMKDFSKDLAAPIILVPLDELLLENPRLGIPVDPIFIMQERPSLDWDADAAKTCLSAAHWIDVQLKMRRSICNAIANSATEIRTRLAQEYNTIDRQWSPWKFSWSVLVKELKLIEKLLLSTSARELLGPKHDSALQIAKAMSGQEKDMLDLKNSCMKFEKLDVPSVSAEKDQQEALAMEQMLKKVDAIFHQFRTDKAMRMDREPETYHNELKWHCLQKKQLQSHWQWCKERLANAENNRFKNFVQIAAVFFKAASQLSNALTKAEIGVRNMEEINRAFDASLDKLPLESRPVRDQLLPAAAIGNGQMSTSVTAERVANSVQSKVDSLQSLKVANSFLSMVKEIQELRGVAQDNRQLLERLPSGSLS